MSKNLSIVIPILNEKKNILKLVYEIKKKCIGLNFEVIFVDDNSTDGSIKILKKLKKIDNRFKYIINNGERDLTQSCFKGIKLAKKENVVVMDGDLQHNPIYIKHLMNRLITDNSDLVIACRNFNKTDSKSLSFIRASISKILIYSLKILSGKNYIDPMSGFFIFKKKIFFKNKKLFYGKGYKILADFIYNIPDIKVSEIYINFRSRKKGSSKMNLKVLIILLFFMAKI